MKKKKTLLTLFAILVCFTALIVLLQYNHMDQLTYTMADVSEITFEELLSPPYVTVDDWSFVDQWSVRCGGQSTDSRIASKGSVQKLWVGLEELLGEELLQAYLLTERKESYHQHVKELLDETKFYHTYLQIRAKSNPGTPIRKDDSVLRMLQLYIRDASECYLVLSYRTGRMPSMKAYVFSIYDPVVLSQLVSYAANLTTQYPTEPDPTEPFRDGNGSYPPSVFVNDKLYGPPYSASYSEIPEGCVYLGEITECVGANNIPSKNFQANYSPVGTKVYQYQSVILLEEGGKYCAYVEEEPLDFFSYEDTVQVSFHDVSYANENGSVNHKITEITLAEEEKNLLLELLDPYYGEASINDVLKTDFHKYYQIEVDGETGKITIKIDTEGNGYGQAGDYYMSIQEHHPMGFLEGTYVKTDLMNFLAEQLEKKDS